MHCCTAGALPDLLAATETVGDDYRFCRRVANSWQQHALAHGLCYLKLVTFKSEGPGHSATACIRALYCRSGALKQFFLIGHFHERFVMTVTVQENFSRY